MNEFTKYTKKLVKYFVFYVMYGCFISLSLIFFGVHGRDMQF